MRKLLMAVVTGLVLMGASVTTKAASLLKSPGTGISKDKDSNLVLKHANQLFGTSNSYHGSHRSHRSHASHKSHLSSV